MARLLRYYIQDLFIELGDLPLFIIFRGASDYAFLKKLVLSLLDGGNILRWNNAFLEPQPSKMVFERKHGRGTYRRMH